MKNSTVKKIAIILIINIIIFQLSCIITNKTYASFGSIRCESPSRPKTSHSNSKGRI